ncbi:RICIN domain-containing protein (plasmid) [Streptomyces sp. BI20]|uniref:RICIN domain-containing protein n=1 Tax=Streptomyces sp. BI20 TaxID=3403460 RepID=UPI003C7768F6
MSATTLLTVLALLGALLSALTAPAAHARPVAAARSGETDGPRLLVTPPRDTSTILRNPAMGWQLYVEKEIPDPETFWNQIGGRDSVASELYIRLPWSQFEPTRGHYAWKENDDYRRLVEEALRRGLKLAFRITVDSQDTNYSATPDYVFDEEHARPAPQNSNTGFRNPLLTDPAFRAAFATFLTEFAKEYDDPARVDFVDTTGLGWWGEGHHLQLAEADLGPTLDWSTALYRTRFTRVLLTLNFGSEFTVAREDTARSAGGLATRRDSLGSLQYFPAEAQQALAERFPASPVFSENCYQEFVLRPTDSCDGAIGRDGLGTVLGRVVADAKNVHANTLDLRHPGTDVHTWVDEYPSLVRDFALNGGYRLAPDRIEAPASFPSGTSVPITQTWSNTAVGVLPNKLPGWNGKYRVSYALLRADDSVAARSADSVTDPGDWLRGTPATTTTRARFDAPPGEYRLAVALVDTTDGGRPGIDLALAGPRTGAGWYPLGGVTLTPAPGPILGQGSGLCVDVLGGGDAPGTPVGLWPCRQGANQSWTAGPSGTLTALGRCLAPATPSPVPGTPVVVAACDGTPVQSWTSPNADLTLRHGTDGLCLDARNAATGPGTRLILWPCHGGPNQRWTGSPLTT